MTKTQTEAIDNLYAIRGRLSAKEKQFLDTCGKVRYHDPALNMSPVAAQQLIELSEKYAKQIRKAKKNAYVLLPSGEPA